MARKKLIRERTVQRSTGTYHYFYYSDGTRRTVVDRSEEQKESLREAASRKVKRDRSRRPSKPSTFYNKAVNQINLALNAADLDNGLDYSRDVENYKDLIADARQEAGLPSGDRLPKWNEIPAASRNEFFTLASQGVRPPGAKATTIPYIGLYSEGRTAYNNMWRSFEKAGSWRHNTTLQRGLPDEVKDTLIRMALNYPDRWAEIRKQNVYDNLVEGITSQLQKLSTDSAQDVLIKALDYWSSEVKAGRTYVNLADAIKLYAATH